ncbi:hypothetical protein TEA_008152 [Camellia sinensis var. sinensis]|uniref:Protein kinase domain-containing protein n=1 Tax=Camellia sinensis var. sinensis TaxID=542762 RepID=A0A4S4DQS3_CAMSN|nr:hypothetical protein TEA_008152 [Camellia sinensis var. sinensis]
MYTTMIHGLCKMKWIGEARKFWFEMVHKGIVPNEYTYNAFIYGLCRIGNLKEAKELYNEMCCKGYKETTVSCNIMIKGLCLRGRTEEAHVFFQEMAEKGIARDIITYNSLIQGFCKEGKIDESINLLAELLEKGMQPSAATYTALIEKLCEMGDVDEAKELWEDMQNRGVEPAVCTHDFIITGLSNKGYVAEGMEWLAAMLRRNLKPQKQTFERLIQCLSQGDKLDEAILVLDYMFSIGYTLRECICHSLVDKLCEQSSNHVETCLGGILQKDTTAFERVFRFVLCSSLWLLGFSKCFAFPKGVNFEVQALMGIRDSLDDPHGVLENWDVNAVDPCNWTIVTCSADKLVIGLGTPSQNLLGSLSPSIGNLTNLQIVRLNNNSLSGSIPFSLANMTQLASLDLSYNNLNGPVPRFLAKTFNLMGNPMICATGTEKDCNGTTAMLLSYPLNNAQKQLHEQVCLGNLKRFQFRELQSATKNFSSKSIIGKGGFGNVYKGYLQDGTVVAVKRLKDGNAVGGEIQFQTEAEMISLAVHRNLLRLYGFCMTSSERLLVYPYMSNGSVASCLKAKPTLDWGTRKRIALGAARGLLYLHEQCNPKIIHRDVKAANILLADYYEAVSIIDESHDSLQIFPMLCCILSSK